MRRRCWGLYSVVVLECSVVPVKLSCILGCSVRALIGHRHALATRFSVIEYHRMQRPVVMTQMFQHGVTISTKCTSKGTSPPSDQ